jgi:hypothetical protein
MGTAYVAQATVAGQNRVTGTRSNGAPIGSVVVLSREFMQFEIIGEITEVETIATSGGIRELPRLQKVHGRARWRKMRGLATVRLPDGIICKAEVHWYEAHGIGRKEMKIKHIL